MDLIAAFYGCLYCGCVPVTVRPPHPQNLATTLPTVKMIVEVSVCGGPTGRPDCGPECWSVQGFPLLPGSGCFFRAPQRGLLPGIMSHCAFDPCALQVSKSACVLTTQAIMRLLKSKEAAATVDVRTWPTILDTGTCLQRLWCVYGPHHVEPSFLSLLQGLQDCHSKYVRKEQLK